MLNQTITEALDGGANRFTLLTCDDDPNYDLTTDGTNVAEVEPGARIVAIQLVLTIFALVSGRTVEWVLGKDPDNALGAASTTVASLYNSDITTGNTWLRKNTIAMGHVIASTNRDLYNSNVNVPRKAMARVARMADGDAFYISFADAGEGVGNALFYLRGRIITRGP